MRPISAFILLAILIASNQSQALIVEQICKRSFAAISKRFQPEELSRPEKLVWAGLRAKLAKDSDAELNAVEKQLIEKLPEAERQWTVAKQSQSKIGNWLQAWMSSGTAYQSLGKKGKTAVLKVLKNPTAELSTAEKSLVKIWGFGENAEMLREIARAHGPTLVAFDRLRQIKPALAATIFSAGLLTYYGIPENELTRPKYREIKKLAADEFEINFYDIHTSIRVGEHEYDYMAVKANRDELQDYDNKKSRRVRIKVTPEEVEALKAFLEKEVDARGLYLGFGTLLTTCTSNINRAAAKTTSFSVPSIFSRSPALTLGYLKLRKLTGDSQIARIDQVAGADVATPGFDIKNGVAKSAFDIGDIALSSLFFLDNSVIGGQIDRTESGFSFSRPNADLPAKK